MPASSLVQTASSAVTQLLRQSLDHGRWASGAPLRQKPMAIVRRLRFLVRAVRRGDAKAAARVLQAHLAETERCAIAAVAST